MSTYGLQAALKTLAKTLIEIVRLLVGIPLVVISFAALRYRKLPVDRARRT